VARRAAWGVLAFTLAGALVGGAVWYAVATTISPSRSAAILDSVPTVDDDAIEQVSDEMEEDGPRSVTFGPLRMGTPYKLYARAAFLLWSIPGRLERFLPLMLLALLAGTVLRRLIEARPRAVFSAYAGLWLAFYTVYVIRIGM
jgi:membrane protein DedA with SNARE-associated domain